MYNLSVIRSMIWLQYYKLLIRFFFKLVNNLTPPHLRSRVRGRICTHVTRHCSSERTDQEPSYPKSSESVSSPTRPPRDRRRPSESAFLKTLTDLYNISDARAYKNYGFDFLSCTRITRYTSYSPESRVCTIHSITIYEIRPIFFSPQFIYFIGNTRYLIIW